MPHQHKYDKQGNQLCCAATGNIDHKLDADQLSQHQRLDESGESSAQQKKQDPAAHDHDDHQHTHDAVGHHPLRIFGPAIISFILLLTGLLLDYYFVAPWFTAGVRLAWYLFAYIPVGLPVIKAAMASIGKGVFFSEFLLMSIATIGAFAIAEFPEGVAVMLFYAVGEVLQTLAVANAKSNIKALLDQRPDEVRVMKDDVLTIMKAKEVATGIIIQLKPGEKAALDGELLSDNNTFDTAALTGESKPSASYKGDTVLAGMINLHTPALIKVTAAYENSKLSKILALVQDAVAKKAPTELFIRKFARVYTPLIVILALLICCLPYFIMDEYQLKTWLYRALVFLVISCPCALVIAIPLGYFGGIGAASKHGILFKGGNYIDALAAVKHVVMDKTGTLTAGVFEVQQIEITPGNDTKEILALVHALESNSTHPVAVAIHTHLGASDAAIQLQNIKEVPGRGMVATYKDQLLLVGNASLLNQYGISYPPALLHNAYTSILISYANKYVGHIIIADTIKEDAQLAVQQLQHSGIALTMLSGDKTAVVEQVAATLGITHAYGELLPADKVSKLKGIKQKTLKVAFVGDGVNDAPVIALSDVGIAMGGLGSDATIEIADVVIQDDKVLKIPMAIRIARQTQKIVWQNVGLAFGVKVLVLILGAGGMANMWEAVFADVGVALLAILNAIRIQKMQF